MAATLVQILLAMALATVLGFAIGAAWARAHSHRTPSPDMAAPSLGLSLEAVVAREADLIEELAHAHSDLEAHAVEIADANGEIVALLADLHEARTVPGPGVR